MMKQLACGHFDMRIVDYAEDYRWIVRCDACGARESWTQREWGARLVVDDSQEGPPLQIGREADSARLLPV